ncbi:MAG: alpha/beta fold hydrolase [Chloroflexota bacterium]
MRDQLIALVCLLLFGITVQGQQTIGWDASDCLVNLILPDETICGTLTVPEDYNIEDRLIELPVVIISARDNTDNLPPLLYTSGGPGGATVYQWLVNFYRRSPISENRDIILFGQRGTLGAEPYLDCPELDLIGLELLSTNNTAVVEGQRWAEVARECFDRLTGEGVDLAHYNNATTIQDIDFLRDTLGHEQVFFLGFSYSTRLALDYTRAYPQHVAGLILDSVAPPEESLLLQLNNNFGRSFDYLFAQCDADDACREAFPNLETTFYETIASYNAQPVTIQTHHPRTQETVMLTVTGNDIASMVVSLLYSRDTTELTPLLIDTLAQEQHDPLLPIVDQFIVGVEQDAVGVYYSTICAEEAAFATSEQIQASRNSLTDMPAWYPVIFGTTHIICDLWDVPASDDVIKEPVSSDVPALILSGGYDPITPPQWGETVVANFPNSYFVEFPTLSHIVFSDHICARNLVNAFLDEPRRAPDTACLNDVPTLDFLQPNEVVVTNSLYRVNRDILAGNQQWQLVFPAIITLSSLLQICIVIWQFTRKSARSADYLHMVSALLVVVWLMGLAWVILNTPELTLAYGLPRWGIGLRWLPFLMVANVLVGIWLVLREKWLWWDTFFIFHLVFVIWLVVRGLAGI